MTEVKSKTERDAYWTQIRNENLKRILMTYCYKLHYEPAYLQPTNLTNTHTHTYDYYDENDSAKKMAAT